MDIMAFIDALEAHVRGNHRPEIADMSDAGMKWWFEQVRKLIKKEQSDAVRKLESISNELQRAEMLHRELYAAFEAHLLPELRSASRIIQDASAAYDARKAALMLSNVPSTVRKTRAAAALSKLSSQLIIEAVCAHTNISRNLLTGARRHKNIANARHVAAFLLYHLRQLSTTQIGELLGGRDHTTVIHAIKKVRRSHELREMATQIASTIGVDDVIMGALSDEQENEKA